MCDPTGVVWDPRQKFSGRSFMVGCLIGGVMVGYYETGGGRTGLTGGVGGEGLRRRHVVLDERTTPTPVGVRVQEWSRRPRDGERDLFRTGGYGPRPVVDSLGVCFRLLCVGSRSRCARNSPAGTSRRGSPSLRTRDQGDGPRTRTRRGARHTETRPGSGGLGVRGVYLRS